MNIEELFRKRDIKAIIEFFKNNKEFVNLDIRSLFKSDNEYKLFMRRLCINYTKTMIKESLNYEDVLSVYIGYIDSFDEIMNMLFENLFEHFVLYFPEASLKLQTMQKFLDLDKIDRNYIAKKLNITPESYGIDLEKIDVSYINSSFNILKEMKTLRDSYENRVVSIVENIAPNTSKVATPMVAARLISAAGGLRRLMLMPSSTIQIIGAEKAIFRHLRRKSKPPKHGIIFMSPYVSGVDQKYRGRMARALASKISIAAKVDYFKGGVIWKKLVKDLDKKLEAMKK